MPTKVLIVDDEHTIDRTLTLVLREHGFAVNATYDGESAVNIAMNWQPDIFLSGDVLPGMSAYEAAVQICGVHPQCRVLLFSAQPRSDDDINPPGTGLEIEVLPKPIHADELLDKLRSAPAVFRVN
jgi:two-component system KDP operon response regulator KdpE